MNKINMISRCFSHVESSCHNYSPKLFKWDFETKNSKISVYIDFDLTSYVARHSFASNLKDKGIATDTISEAMGHQNIKVTQTYLKRLENSVIDNAMDSLIDF
jgi:site-specific recombinase XerD